MNNTASAVDLARLKSTARRFAHIPGGLTLPNASGLSVLTGSSNFAASKTELSQEGPTYNHSMFKGRTDEEKRHLIELNEYCAVGVLGSSSRVIWQPDPTKPPKFLSFKDVRELEATRIAIVKSEGGGKKKLRMFNEWSEWEHRRFYREIKFAPGSTDPSIYNLFTGWEIDPVQGDWSLLRAHLENVICAGDQAMFKWFMTYFAHMFQHPGVKIPVAVVIRGKKGAGKSIVFDYFRLLMSRYMTKIADGKRALGNFNSRNETCILALLEEAFWAGDMSKESILKDWITSPTQQIERKGVEPYDAANYMRVVMLSNEGWVVPASHDERRYAFFDCANLHCRDISYFKAMTEQMRDGGGAAAMLYDLLHYVPENGWDVLYSPPASAGLQEQVVESLRGLDRFMFELLSNGVYECEACDDGGIFLGDAQKAYSLTDIRTAAKDYLADNFASNRQAKFDQIVKAAREWFGAKVAYRQGAQNKLRWIEFPALADCREHAARTKNIRLPDLSTFH
jgi:hypothetical protein